MSVNRQELLRAATLVRPAIASQGYIKSLTHLRLSDDGITACNDITAINVDIAHELDCCVPGDLFVKALSGFVTSEVKITPQEDQSITLVSGRGKLKLPTLGVADFPFHWPPYQSADLIRFNDDMLKGLQRCLVSVGNNINHLSQMGVTLDQLDGHAVFFSTDNVSITRYETDGKISLPADAPVVLPTFFCEQLLSLAKAFPDDDLTLYLLDNALMLVVGKEKARLHSRQLVELHPLDFPAIVRKHVADLDTLEKDLAPMPPGWDETLERAQLVLSSVAEPRMVISNGGDTLEVYAKSDMGQLDEALKWDGPALKREFAVNPSLLSRVSAVSSHVYFGHGVVVLGTKDAKLIHLVATFGKQQPKK